MWEDQFVAGAAPPYPVDDSALLVAFVASAEIGCHLALGWPLPVNVLDLDAEFKVHVNDGRRRPRGLLGVLRSFGIQPSISDEEKDRMHRMAVEWKRGQWDQEKKRQMLDYCETDVVALGLLYSKLKDRIDWDRALLRGRYMISCAKIQHTGIPLDVQMTKALRGNWGSVRQKLIDLVDARYGIYQETVFKLDRFKRYLIGEGIPWPYRSSGKLALDRDTFKLMEAYYPQIADLGELRETQNKLKLLPDLAVGDDGRNRVPSWAFGTKTGRNAPKTHAFIFGPSKWVRALIRAEPGKGLAYLDWKQQEFGVAAALSGDVAMQRAYHDESKDPYVAFAKMAGALQDNMSSETRQAVRKIFKEVVIGAQYCMGPKTLARKIRRSPSYAMELLDKHRSLFPKFWSWSAATLDVAALEGELKSVFGWRLRVSEDLLNTHVPTIKNFLVQANGAEMLRLACIFATEAGVTVCASVHDALMIEAPIAELDDAIAATEAAMADASQMVLDGFTLRTDVATVKEQERFLALDARDLRMWKIISDLAHGLGLVPPENPSG
jgi:hypothetical protein